MEHDYNQYRSGLIDNKLFELLMENRITEMTAKEEIKKALEAFNCEVIMHSSENITEDIVTIKLAKILSIKEVRIVKPRAFILNHSDE